MLQLRPMDQVAADGVAPTGMLHEQVVLALVVQQAVGIVHAAVIARVMELRAVLVLVIAAQVLFENLVGAGFVLAGIIGQHRRDP